MKFSFKMYFANVSAMVLFGALGTPSQADTYNIPTIGWLDRLQAVCDRTECAKTGARALTLDYATCNSEKDLSKATEIRKSQGFGSDYIVWSEFTLPSGQICVRTEMPSADYLTASESQLLLSASLGSEIAFTRSSQNLIPAGDESQYLDSNDAEAAPISAKVFRPNISGPTSNLNQIPTRIEKELPFLINAKGMPAFLDDTTVFTLGVGIPISSKLASGTVATSTIFWVDENEVILGNKPTLIIRGVDFDTGVHLIAVGNSASGPYSDSFEFEVRRSQK